LVIVLRGTKKKNKKLSGCQSDFILPLWIHGDMEGYLLRAKPCTRSFSVSVCICLFWQFAVIITQINLGVFCLFFPPCRFVCFILLPLLSEKMN